MVFKIIKIIALGLIAFYGNQYVLKIFIPTLSGKMLEKVSMILTVPIVLCYILCGADGLIREGFEDSELNQVSGATKVVEEIEAKEADELIVDEMEEVSKMSDEELKKLQTDIEIKLAEALEEETSDVELTERGDLGHNVPTADSGKQKIQIADQETSIDLDNLAAERQADLERTGAPIPQVDINSDVEPADQGVMPGASEDIQAKYVLLPMDQWLTPQYRPGNCFQPSIEVWVDDVLSY